MMIREFYETIRGDYDDMLDRIPVDALILRFVRLYPSDDSFRELMEAVKRGDVAASFQAVHKLKGVAANLSFSELYAAASVLCEQLRPQTEPADAALVQRVSECHWIVMRAIDGLEGGERMQ